MNKILFLNWINSFKFKLENFFNENLYKIILIKYVNKKASNIIGDWNPKKKVNIEKNKKYTRGILKKIFFKLFLCLKLFKLKGNNNSKKEIVVKVGKLYGI